MSASASLELESALQALGDQLATELRLLNELPQVYLTEKCVFDRGNGRAFALQTSGSGVPSVVSCAVASSYELDQKCNALSGERACPTVVDAVRLLRAKV